MVVSSAVCIVMCICEMIYLVCKRIQKRMRRKFEANMRKFAEKHEMTSLGVAKYEFRSKTSVKTDPTASEQNLSNIKAEEAPPKEN